MEYVKKPELFQMAAASLSKVITINEQGDGVLFRSTMSPGCNVPLHSHVDPEAFYILSGTLEVLIVDDEPRWHRVWAGTSIVLENGVRHAVRNTGDSIAEFMVITNRRLADFFQRAGAPVDDISKPAHPSSESIKRILDISEEFGYWIASREENDEFTAVPIKDCLLG